jgi:hypothetical protein
LSTVFFSDFQKTAPHPGWMRGGGFWGLSDQ